MNDTQLYQTLLGLEPPWEVRSVEMDSESEEILVNIHYTSNRAICPNCGEPCAIYDHRNQRRWRHLDTCQMKTIIVCNVPRCDCQKDGKRTIEVPWARDHSRFTMLFERLAIDMLKYFKKQSKVAKMLRISFDQIHYIMYQSVERGLARRRHDEVIEHLGIDEKSYARHHQYSSILFDINHQRVLDLTRDRDEKSALKLIKNSLTEKQRSQVKAVSMDMWQAYMNAAAKALPQADIVHDHFHLIKYLNQAVDQTRRQEMKDLDEERKGSLKNTRYVFLSNPITMSDAYKRKLMDLQRLNLETSKAWRLKENFKMVFKCDSIENANYVFNAWLKEVKRFKIKAVSKVAEMFIAHSIGILNYLRHRISNAMAEALNSIIQEIKYVARGFRKYENFRIAVLFFLGKLDLYPHKTQ